MATKWHPASGKWGTFGETSGSKSASRARGQIGTALADLEDSRQNITSYYESLSNLESEKSEEDMLTGLEQFLDKSYNIKSEFEETAGKTNLPTVINKNVIMAQDKIEKDKDKFLKNFQYQEGIRELNLGRQEESELFQLDNIIRNLKLSREEYS